MGLFLQGLKRSAGRALDLPQASEHTDSDRDFGDRRQRRELADRRKTRNRVFEARARRVGMTLDRRRPATVAGEGSRWVDALRERCVGWWRPRGNSTLNRE